MRALLVGLLMLSIAACDGTPNAAKTDPPSGIPEGVKVTKLDPLTPAQLHYIHGCALVSGLQIEDTKDQVSRAQGLRDMGCLEIKSIEWKHYEEWRDRGGLLPRVKLVPMDEPSTPGESE